MLDNTLKTQLKAYLERIVQPVELIATLDDGDKSREMRGLLEDIAALSGGRVSLRTAAAEADVHVPSFAVGRADGSVGIRFAGIPLGHEFTSLVLALLQTGGHPPKVAPDLIAQIRALPGEYRFRTYISLSCQNCPDVVQALNLMAVLNPRVTHEMIDGALFQDEVERLSIMAVPTVLLNGETFGQGRMSLEEIVAKLDSGAGARAADRLNAKEPFDVLVVGGGPAGLATAIRLKQLALAADRELAVCLLEKGSEIGAHILSGACIEPRALDELFPDWRELGAPLLTPAGADRFLFLTAQTSYRLPTPPTMHNHGNYVASLGNLCRWLGTQAEELGVEIYAGFAAAEVLYDETGAARGVATGDMGLDKDGQPTDAFEVTLSARYDSWRNTDGISRLTKASTGTTTDVPASMPPLNTSAGFSGSVASHT